MKLRTPAVLPLLLATLCACQGSAGDPGVAADLSTGALTSGGVNATLALQSDWTAGYCANLVLANAGTAAVTSWTLVVELNQSTLSNLWGGTSSVSGSQLTIKPADYTSSIAPGASVNLGFCATATGGNYRPALASLTVSGGGPSTVTLAVVPAGTGTGTVTSTPSGISCGATCTASFAAGTAVTLSAAAASNSRFTGWGSPCAGTGACVVTLASAQSVTATFDALVGNTYPLNVSKTGNGSGTVTSSAGGVNCGSTCSAGYPSGTTVTLTATAASGSAFASWSGDCVGTSTCILSMTAPRSVTATFATAVIGDTKPSAGCGKTPGISGSQYNNGSTIAITAAGMQRRYILNVPTGYDNTHPYRLVIAYHELNGNDKEMYAHGYYHLLNLANNSTIFVAPNGQKNGAPCTGTGTGDSGCGWPNPNNSDIALADAVVAQIAQNFCVDMNRIFVTGWSYGGSMSYKTSCERPQGGAGSWSVRGAAVYSGAQLSGSCTPSKPVAYYASHGTGDSVLGYDLGVGLFQNFARANGCTYVTPTRVTSGNHVCTTLAGCASGYPTQFCSFNGGHTPDPSDGGTSWEYQNVWSFFSKL